MVAKIVMQCSQTCSDYLSANLLEQLPTTRKLLGCLKGFSGGLRQIYYPGPAHNSRFGP